MPLDDRVIFATVSIIGDRRESTHPYNVVRGPVGSGFLVQVPSESRPERLYNYVVTAHHVLRDQPKIEVLALDPNGRPFGLRGNLDWRQPLDHVDLAIASWPSSQSLALDRPFCLLAFHRQAFSDALARRVALGTTINYVGLLEQPEVPMVRSGTLGAVYCNDIVPEPYDYTAHLIDCRSFGGFSGSPVYAEVERPILRKGGVGLPVPDDAPDLPLGAMIYFQYLYGLFTAHLDDPTVERDDDGLPVQVINRHGVGVILPVEYIRAGLHGEEFVMARRTADEQANQEGARKPRLRNASSPSAVPKRDMDERVSLWPLSGEDALRGLLATPPLDQDEG